MRFDFKLIPQKDLEELIKSVLDKTGKQYEDEAVAAIARAGAGSARDSLSIADMCASYSTGKLTYSDVNTVLGSADFSVVADLGERILCEKADEALSGIENILSTGKSVGVLVKDLLNFLNACAIIKICKNAKEILNLPSEAFLKISAAAEKCDGHKILRVTEILSKAENDMRYSLNGRITLETAVIKCALPQEDYNIDALIGKINALERKIADGVQIKTETAKPRSSPAEVIKESPAESKPSARLQPMSGETEQSPFGGGAETVQPTVWEAAKENLAQKPASELTQEEKNGLFGKFIKSLRTTRRNAVLFTLCMDLNSFFEGAKIVFTTDNEAVYKGLTKVDNANFISETLAELGVTEHEVRLVKKGESGYEAAVKELKSNFEGIDVIIK